jgi:hypothetical protein
MLFRSEAAEPLKELAAEGSAGAEFSVGSRPVHVFGKHVTGWQNPLFLPRSMPATSRI